MLLEECGMKTVAGHSWQDGRSNATSEFLTIVCEQKGFLRDEWVRLTLDIFVNEKRNYCEVGIVWQKM